MAIKDSQIYPITSVNPGSGSVFLNGNILSFNRFKIVGYFGSSLNLINNTTIQLRGF